MTMPTENLICPYCGHSHPFEDDLAKLFGAWVCRGCNREFEFKTHWDTPTFTSTKKRVRVRELKTVG